MTGRVMDLDHLMVSAKNVEDIAETYGRMGFTLTPRSGLPGMSNRLVCFAPPSADRCNFVEFLSLEDPAQAPQIMSDILLPPDRPVSMVMVSDDTAACAQTLESKGLQVSEPWHLKRDWSLPDGEVISPEFIVAIPTVGQAPVYWNVCQYITPEHYRRPEFLVHRNTVTRFSGALAVAADPAAAADHYVRFWDADVSAAPEGGVRIALDNMWLSIATPDQVAARYANAGLTETGPDARLFGFAAEAADMERLSETLEAGGFDARPDDHRGLWLPPDQTHGCLIHFVPQPAP